MAFVLRAARSGGALSPRTHEERATGVEPATSSLGSWHSTTELRPQRPETVAHSSSPRNTRGSPARFLDCPGTRAYDPRTRMATPRARSSSSQTAIRALFEASARAREVFLQENADALERAVDLVAEALGAGRKLLLFGNGGSAADAQHLAAELVGRFQRERRPLPAIALTTDTSALTAIANDYGYDQVFARQVRALGVRGDVALAISTSGRSPSVLRAVEACRELGIETIALTGGDGGTLAGLVDLCLRVSASTDAARIQETHILIGHVLCELVERRLFGGS